MVKLLLSTLLLSGILCGAPPLHAQSFTAAPLSSAGADASSKDWTHVQALAPNTALHIKARTHSVHCRLQSADVDTLTCLTAGKPETYQRADIQSIKVPHRTRSTLIGLGAGAGVGAIIGAAAGGGGTGSFDILSRGDVAAIFAIPFAIIGAIVGALTDFTSTTIYRI